jgi:hypothetical protein
VEYVFRHHGGSIGPGLIDDYLIYQLERLDPVHSALESIDKYFAVDDSLVVDHDHVRLNVINDADGLNDDHWLDDNGLHYDRLHYDRLNHDDRLDDGLCDDVWVFLRLYEQHAASESEHRFDYEAAAVWVLSTRCPLRTVEH